MKAIMNINTSYNSLDAICKRLQQNTDYACTKEYDIWEQRTDVNGQMEQCVVLKKSGMHGVKVYLTGENNAKVSYIVPSKVMNAYFGHGGERHKNIIEIIVSKIVGGIMAGPQKNAFNELQTAVSKALA